MVNSGGAWGLWIICNRNLVLEGENMYNLTYFGGYWNEKLEFWNLVFFVVLGTQNGGGVLKNMVFIYIVVVVVEYINSKIPRFQ